MPIEDLKKELMQYIENTNDESLLSLVKEDFVFYQNLRGADITDDLTEAQSKELRLLAEEDETKDIHTLAEFKKATDQWRTR
jgi:hypothetical protein